MNKLLTILFICIVTISYSQSNNFNIDAEIIEVKSYNISGLYLTRKFIDSLDLHIEKINLSIHRRLFSHSIRKKYVEILKETHCSYIKTKALVQIDNTIITKKREREKELEKIKMEDIKSIVFLDKHQAKKIYGWWRGRYGAIIIETKNK